MSEYFVQNDILCGEFS